MVLEDSRLQKSMQINEKLVRKQVPKKVFGIERKRCQNGTQIEARNLQKYENTGK